MNFDRSGYSSTDEDEDDAVEHFAYTAEQRAERRVMRRYVIDCCNEFNPTDYLVDKLSTRFGRVVNLEALKKNGVLVPVAVADELHVAAAGLPDVAAELEQPAAAELELPAVAELPAADGLINPNIPTPDGYLKLYDKLVTGKDMEGKRLRLSNRVREVFRIPPYPPYANPFLINLHAVSGLMAPLRTNVVTKVKGGSFEHFIEDWRLFRNLHQVVAGGWVSFYRLLERPIEDPHYYLIYHGVPEVN